MTSEMRGAVPRDGDWVKGTNRVAAIYGANASGKSTVLHALDFMLQAVENSASRWAAREEYPYFPCGTDAECQEQTSEYEIDFVIDNTRYTYGFESDANGIHSEWLYSFRTARRTTLFERDHAAEPIFSFGRSLPGENVTIAKQVTRQKLFLSVAANGEHPVLWSIQRYLLTQFNYAKFTDQDQMSRLRWIRDILGHEEVLRKTESLLRFADLGISSISLESRELDPHAVELFEGLMGTFGKGASPEEREKQREIFTKDLQKSLKFIHDEREGGNGAAFGIHCESRGTVAWLSLVVPALRALETGGVFLVDEIDSSLHTKLTVALISMFKDSEINSTGAQLIFTSHDLTLLGNLAGQVLDPGEIWFIEKSAGTSVLYALDEFQYRSSDNFEKRYLEGRYGAIPMVSKEELRAALSSSIGAV